VNATISLHYEPWIVNLNALARVKRQSVAVTVRDESRLWLQQAMRLAPPTRGRLPGGGKHTKRSTTKDQLATGEKAVRRDIVRAATPADPDWPDALDLFRAPWMRKIILSGNKEKFTKAIAAIGKLKNWRVETWSESLHQRARGSRGRVHSTKRVFIIGAGQLESYWRYMTRTISHVGRLKAGFAACLVRLGFNRGLPPFVRRHLNGARGEATFDLNDGTRHPFVQARIWAKGVADAHMVRIARDTFKARSEAMKRRMHLIEKNFAKGAVSTVKAVRSSRGSIAATLANQPF
jgi:hypothetical protein